MSDRIAAFVSWSVFAVLVAATFMVLLFIGEMALKQPPSVM